MFVGHTAPEENLCLAAMKQAKQLDTIPGPLVKEEKIGER